MSISGHIPRPEDFEKQITDKWAISWKTIDRSSDLCISATKLLTLHFSVHFAALCLLHDFLWAHLLTYQFSASRTHITAWSRAWQIGLLLMQQEDYWHPLLILCKLFTFFLLFEGSKLDLKMCFVWPPFQMWNSASAVAPSSIKHFVMSFWPYFLLAIKYYLPWVNYHLKICG